MSSEDDKCQAEYKFYPDMARPGLARKELSCHPTALHEGALSARNTEGEFSGADQIYVTFLMVQHGETVTQATALHFIE